jgi:hypothetical protein
MEMSDQLHVFAALALYTLDTRLGGPRTGLHSEEEKNLLHLPGIKP